MEIRSAVACEGELRLMIAAGEEISLYPNPIEAEVQLFFPEAPTEDFLLEIYNSAGQLVKSGWQKSGDRKITVGAEDLEPGIYFIRLHLQQIKNIKMIKS